MKSKLEFTVTAEVDLREIVMYITEQTKDKSIALNFLKNIREKCLVLEDFPEIGTIPKDRVLVGSDFRFIVFKEYLIFYKYDKMKNTVYIHAVIHSKRDYMRVMRKYL